MSLQEIYEFVGSVKELAFQADSQYGADSLLPLMISELHRRNLVDDNVQAMFNCTELLIQLTHERLHYELTTLQIAVLTVSAIRSLNKDLKVDEITNFMDSNRDDVECTINEYLSTLEIEENFDLPESDHQSISTLEILEKLHSYFLELSQALPREGSSAQAFQTLLKQIPFSVKGFEIPQGMKEQRDLVRNMSKRFYETLIQLKGDSILDVEKNTLGEVKDLFKAFWESSHIHQQRDIRASVLEMKGTKKTDKICKILDDYKKYLEKKYPACLNSQMNSDTMTPAQNKYQAIRDMLNIMNDEVLAPSDREDAFMKKWEANKTILMAHQSTSHSPEKGILKSLVAAVREFFAAKGGKMVKSIDKILPKHGDPEDTSIKMEPQ